VRAATQYYCRACHAAAERPYRAKAKKKLAALYRELAQLRAERTP